MLHRCHPTGPPPERNSRLTANMEKVTPSISHEARYFLSFRDEGGVWADAVNRQSIFFGEVVTLVQFFVDYFLNCGACHHLRKDLIEDCLLFCSQGNVSFSFFFLFFFLMFCSGDGMECGIDTEAAALFRRSFLFSEVSWDEVPSFFVLVILGQGLHGDEEIPFFCIDCDPTKYYKFTA